MACYLSLSLLEALPSAILIIAYDTKKIVLANPAAEQFFSLSQAVMIKEDLTWLVGKNHPVVDIPSQVKEKKGNLTAYEIDFHGPRFDHRACTVEGVWLEDNNKAMALVIHSFPSIRERLLQETIQHEARKMSIITSALAHEIKNPLSGIRGAAQLLEESVTEDDKQLTILIRKEVDRIHSLVEQVDLFDTDITHQDDINIHTVLMHVRKLVEPSLSGQIRFEEDYDPSLPLVKGHWDRLVQVFLNLVKNAVEAIESTGQEGKITLKTAYRTGYRLAGPIQGQEAIYLPVVVTVQDDGGGIPPALEDKIFQSFFTTKTKGKGLGLTLSGKIIAEHGGTIEVQHPPKGCAIVIRLPYTPSTHKSII